MHHRPSQGTVDAWHLLHFLRQLFYIATRLSLSDTLGVFSFVFVSRNRSREDAILFATQMAESVYCQSVP
jgi:hypothetical protein